MTNWYCHECQASFGSEDNEPVCPNGHQLGKWTGIINKTVKCKLCGAELDASYRERLDLKDPKGGVLKRSENDHIILEHFAQNHPQALKKAGRELGIGIKIG